MDLLIDPNTDGGLSGHHRRGDAGQRDDRDVRATVRAPAHAARRAVRQSRACGAARPRRRARGSGRCDAGSSTTSCAVRARRAGWTAINRRYLDRLRKAVPMPTVVLPFLFAEEFGLDEVRTLMANAGPATGTHPPPQVAPDAGAIGPRSPRRRLRGERRRRQDDDGGDDRALGRARGPAGGRAHHRSGSTPRQLARDRRARRRAADGRPGAARDRGRSGARLARGDDARPEERLGSPGRASCPVGRGARAHLEEPLLPQPVAEFRRLARVHGDRAALPAVRERRLRPDRRSTRPPPSARSISSRRPSASATSSIGGSCAGS